VAFDTVLSWLNTLEGSEGLLVQEAAFTQAGAGGRVNATVRLGQGS
jgi:type II secretory pathway component PulM